MGLEKIKCQIYQIYCFKLKILLLLSTVCADVSAKDGTKPRLPEYCFATASSTAGTASRLSRVTVQPPKPPPVILLPYTPATPSAASTSASSSGHDTSKSSLDTRLEAARGEDTCLLTWGTRGSPSSACPWSRSPRPREPPLRPGFWRQSHFNSLFKELCSLLGSHNNNVSESGSLCELWVHEPWWWTGLVLYLTKVERVSES